MQDAVIRAEHVDDADERLAGWLDRVEHGEEITLTRQGRVVARLVPADNAATKLDLTAMQSLLAAMRAHRDRMLADGRPAFTLDEILEMRDEGRRY